jgi:hypothetical protein
MAEAHGAVRQVVMTAGASYFTVSTCPSTRATEAEPSFMKLSGIESRSACNEFEGAPPPRVEEAFLLEMLGYRAAHR